MVLNFKYQLTHSRRIWRGSVNKGLSRSGWPVGMSVGVYLAYIKWGERTQPTAGGTTPQKGDSELQKSREHWRALLCIHPSLCPWVWMSCDQALQGPPISTAPLCCNLDLRVRQTFFFLKLLCHGVSITATGKGNKSRCQHQFTPTVAAYCTVSR